MERKPPPEVQAAVDELAAITSGARQARHLTIDEVARAAAVSRYPVGRLGRGTWLRAGLSEETLHDILCRALNVPDDTWLRARGLFDVVQAWRHQPRGAVRSLDAHEVNGFPLVRYGHTRALRAERPYASIDRLDLAHWPNGHVEGIIERIEPEARRDATWECIGRITVESLLLTFWPLIGTDGSAPQSDSSGQIVVQRESSRRRPWPGAFIKLERHQGSAPQLRQYDYWLSPGDDPKLVQSCSAVAVVDFDNTLAEGWILDPWLRMLAEAGVGGAAEGVERLIRLFADYERRPGLGHDDLAREAAAIYATAMAGVEVDRIAPMAEHLVLGYLSPEGRLFPFARELLTGLRQRGIKPILVTGAPLELIDSVMRHLDIESSFPLMLEQTDGRFTGRVRANRGLGVEKQEVCRVLVEYRDCELVVAIGDSEGDRGMWEAAKVSVRVGGSAHANDVSISGVDLRQPLDPAFWRLIPRASWLDEVQPAAE